MAVEIKRGEPQDSESRPFASVTPEEIEERVGGYIFGEEGEIFRAIDSPLGATFIFNERYHTLEPHNGLEINALEEPTESRFPLDDAEAILGNDFVTVVAPLEASHGKQEVSWVTVRQNEGTTLYTRVRTIGQPWPADVSLPILKAAGKAAARAAMPVGAR